MKMFKMVHIKKKKNLKKKKSLELGTDHEKPLQNFGEPGNSPKLSLGKVY